MNSGPQDFFRARPKQERSADLVGVVLQAAREQFQRRGVAASTTNQIAERAGVSVGSLYRYFPNKEALVAALIERQLDASLSAIDGVLDKARELSDVDTIRLGVRALCDLYFESAPFLSMLFAETHRVKQVQLLVLKRLSFDRMLERVQAARGEGRDEGFSLRVFVSLHAILGVLQAMVERYPECPPREALTAETVHLAVKHLLSRKKLNALEGID